MATAKGGKINKLFLKIRSGEFEVESIHALCLSGADINDLGCISECCCLERLDLSKNHIAKLHKLAGLSNLHDLNISENNLTSLEGLQALDSLTTLNISGNLIESFDCLQCLTELEYLRELRLKDVIYHLSNPICENLNYRNEIITMFPNLYILDGERLRGKGRELYDICIDFDKMLKDTEVTSYRVASPNPWLKEDVFMSTLKQFEKSHLHDAEEQLRGLLAVCHKTVNDADKRLSKLQNE